MTALLEEVSDEDLRSFVEQQRQTIGSVLPTLIELIQSQTTVVSLLPIFEEFGDNLLSLETHCTKAG